MKFNGEINILKQQQKVILSDEDILLNQKEKHDDIIYEGFSNTIDEGELVTLREESELKQAEIETKAEDLIELGYKEKNLFRGKPLVYFLAENCFEEAKEIYKQAQINYGDSSNKSNSEELIKGIMERTIPKFFEERILITKYRNPNTFSGSYSVDGGEHFLFSKITPSLAKYMLKTYANTNGIKYYSKYEIPGHLEYLYDHIKVLQENYSEDTVELLLDYLNSNTTPISYLGKFRDFLNSNYSKKNFNSDFLNQAMDMYKDKDSNKTDLFTYLGQLLTETKWGKENIKTLDDYKRISASVQNMRFITKINNTHDNDGQNFLEDDFKVFIENEKSKEYINKERLDKIFRFLSKHDQYIIDVFGDASTAIIDSCVNNEDDFDNMISFFEKNIKDDHEDLKSLSYLTGINNDLNSKKILKYSFNNSKQNILKISKILYRENIFGTESSLNLFRNIIVPADFSSDELQDWLKRDENNITKFENKYNLFIDKTNNVSIKNGERLKHAIKSIPLPINSENISNETNKSLSVISKILVDAGIAWAQVESKKLIVEKLSDKFESDKFTPEMITDDFINAYIMAINTETNADCAWNLIEEYVEGNTYPFTSNIFDSYPFTEDSNISFLEGNRNKRHKFFKEKNQEKWFQPNEKIFSTKLVDYTEDQIKENNYSHHLKVANRYLERLELEECNSVEELISKKDYFYELRNKALLSNNINLSYVDNILTQIEAIKNVNTKTFSKKEISSIKIYHELNPIKIVMMGNKVDGSCLAYGNSTENYYSTFTNALDVNKAVFYIEDNEKGNIIGRVLCAITGSGTLIRFPMYTKGSPNINLDKYFNTYIKNLASECKLNLSDESDLVDEVDLLISEEWYSEDSLESF